MIQEQKQFGKNDEGFPKNKEELQELLKKEKDKSFEAGKKQGRKETTKSGGNRQSKAPERRKELYDKKVRDRAKRIKKVQRGNKIEKALDPVVLNFEEFKTRPKAYLRKTRIEAKKALKTPKGKAVLIGTGIAAGTGLAKGGARAYKHYKDKKRSEDIRRKVRGYDSPKKK